MNNSRIVRLLGVVLLISNASSLKSQSPFDLDMSFRTAIDTWYVSSILPVANNQLLVSGQVKFPGDLVFRTGGRLNSDGSRDLTYPATAYMGGKLTAWNDRVYSINGIGMRRIWPNGMLDGTFDMISAPHFSPLQAGDYHVFPDGRVLFSGLHQLSDADNGFVGYYCLCWFTDQGYLDTSRIHRTCSGSLDYFQALPDGKFIGSGATSTYDGQPASNIFRFNADGSLDPSFQANVTWGSAFGFLPLEDGRVYAAGQFCITGEPDTLRLVRFLADGSLDPSFNNSLYFERGALSGAYGGVPSYIHALDAERLIVTGGFRSVDGASRKGICAIDTSGVLLPDLFADCGGGTYQYQGLTTGTVRGIVPGPDDSFWVWGSFHGYDDGTTNDTTQRMVSRLYGLDVGVGEREQPPAQLVLHPNPASAWVAMEYNLQAPPNKAQLVVVDLSGRTIWSTPVSTTNQQVVWDARGTEHGGYTVMLYNGGKQVATEKLILQP